MSEYAIGYDARDEMMRQTALYLEMIEKYLNTGSENAYYRSTADSALERAARLAQIEQAGHLERIAYCLEKMLQER